MIYKFTINTLALQQDDIIWLTDNQWQLTLLSLTVPYFGLFGSWNPGARRDTMPESGSLSMYPFFTPNWNILTGPLAWGGRKRLTNSYWLRITPWLRECENTLFHSTEHIIPPDINTRRLKAHSCISTRYFVSRYYDSETEITCTAAAVIAEWPGFHQNDAVCYIKNTTGCRIGKKRLLWIYFLNQQTDIGIYSKVEIGIGLRKIRTKHSFNYHYFIIMYFDCEEPQCKVYLKKWKRIFIDTIGISPYITISEAPCPITAQYKFIYTTILQQLKNYNNVPLRNLKTLWNNNNIRFVFFFSKH